MNKAILFLLAFLPNVIFSQFLAQRSVWPDKFVDYQELPDSLKNNDAVILRERLIFTENTIYRRVAVKILNQKGLDAFKKISIPESFDLTHYRSSARGKILNTISIPSYGVTLFSARIITPNKNIVDLPGEYNIEKISWMNNLGKKAETIICNFKIDLLEIGDILEYTYVDNAGWDKQEMIYPNGFYPKLDYHLKIIWKVTNSYQRDPSIYYYNYLKGINYIQNIPLGLVLPYIQMNQGFHDHKVHAGFVQDGFLYKWKFVTDTIHRHYNDSYNESIRKFIAKFGENKTDTFNSIFLRQLVDTLNSLKFVLVDSSNYKRETTYTPAFPDIFANRELREEKLLEDYDAVLKEKMFFYVGIIIDKRISAVNLSYRNHINSETSIFVIPHKNAFKYIVPRYNGSKYILDELPFYYEGTTCVLLPCYNCPGNNVDNKMKLIYTPGSTFNDNLRTESATFKVNTDSLQITATIRENLRGQFSTLLRPFYNKETIDSTISETYFEKCTDRPNASNVKINLGPSSERFPVSHSYHCSENISLTQKTKIDLHNWFSFTFRKSDYTELPTHDFYFDFQYTDVYNFKFEFDKPTEITNINELTKNLNNDYFEVSSSLTKEEVNSYMLTVIVKIRQNILPEKDGFKLLEFVNLLNQINNYKLQVRL